MPLLFPASTAGLKMFVLCAPAQFELECRPFYVAGFNAHDLVPKSLATPTDHHTEGAFVTAACMPTHAADKTRPGTQPCVAPCCDNREPAGHRPGAGDVCQRHAVEPERRAHLRAHHRPHARLHGALPHLSESQLERATSHGGGCFSQAREGSMRPADCGMGMHGEVACMPQCGQAPVMESGPGGGLQVAASMKG